MTRYLYTRVMSNSNMSKGTEKRPDPAAVKLVLRSFELNAWLAVGAAVYVIALFLIRHHPDWSPGMRSAVCLAPLLPGLLCLRTGTRLLREMDELQRRIQLEGCLFGAIGTVVSGTIINVFNAQGFVGKWPAQGLQVGGAYMTMFVLWCAGATIARLRYR